MPDLRAEPRVCRCEATIPSSILDGFACGNPQCWRTAEAKASFDAFVAELVSKRDGETPKPVDPVAV